MAGERRGPNARIKVTTAMAKAGGRILADVYEYATCADGIAEDVFNAMLDAFEKSDSPVPVLGRLDRPGSALETH